jgi:hypothetical protein
MVTAARVSKKAGPSEAEKGVPLAPSVKDLNPWYSDKTRDRNTSADVDKDEKRYENYPLPSTYRLPCIVGGCILTMIFAEKGIYCPSLGTIL